MFLFVAGIFVAVVIGTAYTESKHNAREVARLQRKLDNMEKLLNQYKEWKK